MEAGRRRIRTRGLLAVALAFAALPPGTARAHGDPASDVVDRGTLFIPSEVAFDSTVRARLVDLVAEGDERGFPVRVVLIARQADLGADPIYWLRPQRYAGFLAGEIAFAYKGRLLIAMPNGFGFWNGGAPVAREVALLKPIRIATGPNGLAAAAVVAVRKLAAHAGHPLALPRAKGGSRTRDRILIAVGAAVALALWALALRFRATIRGRFRRA
jgi:hypothetical protein